MDSLRKYDKVLANVECYEQHLHHNLEYFYKIRQVDLFPKERMVLDDVFSGLWIILEFHLLVVDVILYNRIQ